MRKKGVTLVEVMMALLIVALGLGAVFMVYPQLFIAVQTSSGSVRAWELAREQMEIIKQYPFFTTAPFNGYAYDPQSQQPKPQTLVLSQEFTGSGFHCVYYVQRLRYSKDVDPDENLIPDLLQLELVVWYRVGNRLIGGEEVGGKIISPVTLKTLIMQK